MSDTYFQHLDKQADRRKAEREVAKLLYEACNIGLSCVLSEEGSFKWNSTRIKHAMSEYEALTASKQPQDAPEAPEADKVDIHRPEGIKDPKKHIEGLYKNMEEALEDQRRLLKMLREAREV
jgi:hypothetical protein